MKKKIIHCKRSELRITAQRIKTGDVYRVDEMAIAPMGLAKLYTEKPVDFCVQCGENKLCSIPMVRTSEYVFTIELEDVTLVIDFD